MDSDFKTALDPATKDYDPDLLRPALVGRTIYTFALTENPSSFVALVDGSLPKALAFNNALFWLDQTDTTTPADGVTVLRTSDNYCYKTEDIDYRTRSVISDSITAPPGSPAVGDAYLVPPGATGAWSSHQDDIAHYTVRGWVFEEPRIGAWLLVESIDGYARYSTTGWMYGPGARSFDDGSIPLSAALGWGERVIVESQSVTTPPSATLGLRYVVGAAATGVWSGKDKQVAICEVPGSWTFYAPSNGWKIYDKSQSAEFTFNGTAWLSSVGAWAHFDRVFTPGSGSQTNSVATTDYSFSTSSPPSISGHRNTSDDVVLTRTASRVGAIQRFRYSANQASVGNQGHLGLFIDSVANAIDWVRLNNAAQFSGEFIYVATDTSPHTFKIAVFGNGAYPNAFSRRLFTLEESA